MTERDEFVEALWKAFCGPTWTPYTGRWPEQELAILAVARVALERAAEVAEHIGDVSHDLVTIRASIDIAAAIRALIPDVTAPPPTDQAKVCE